jgi:hypothetical protein
MSVRLKKTLGDLSKLYYKAGKGVKVMVLSARIVFNPFGISIVIVVFFLPLSIVDSLT